MTRKPRAKVTTTDAKIAQAVSFAKTYVEIRPRAISAEYRAPADVVSILLASGVEIVIPRRLLQGLDGATPSTIEEVTVEDYGSTLHWESLDLDHYVPGLIAGVFGNRRWMSEIGKRGGLRKTSAKADAARANGRKGGRPPRSTTKA